MGFTPLRSPNVARQESSEDVRRRATMPNFQFAYHPGDWQITAHGTYRPVIKHIGKVSGVNGYNGHKNPAVDAQRWARARSEAEANGFVFIDHDVLRGAGVEDYVTPYRTDRGKTTYRTVFETPVSMGAGEATDWEHDHEAFDEFIAFLRREGVIQPPKPGVIRSSLKQIEYKLNALSQQRPNDGARLTTWTRTYNGLEAARNLLLREMAASREHYGEAVQSAKVRSLRDKLKTLAQPEPARDVPADLAARLRSSDVVDADQPKPDPAESPTHPLVEMTLVEACDALGVPASARAPLAGLVSEAVDLLDLTDDQWLSLPRVASGRLKSIRAALDAMSDADAGEVLP